MNRLQAHGWCCPALPEQGPLASFCGRVIAAHAWQSWDVDGLNCHEIRWRRTAPKRPPKAWVRQALMHQHAGFMPLPERYDEIFTEKPPDALVVALTVECRNFATAHEFCAFSTK
jgi:hypothetical protein